jgi:hypothetical protein
MLVLLPRVSFAFSLDGLWLGLLGTIEWRIFPSKSTAGAFCRHGSDCPFPYIMRENGGEDA